MEEKKDTEIIEFFNFDNPPFGYPCNLKKFKTKLCDEKGNEFKLTKDLLYYFEKKTRFHKIIILYGLIEWENIKDTKGIIYLKLPKVIKYGGDFIIKNVNGILTYQNTPKTIHNIDEDKLNFKEYIGNHFIDLTNENFENRGSFFIKGIYSYSKILS